MRNCKREVHALVIRDWRDRGAVEGEGVALA
jgi:hypothetical protein